jgi:hypothetical protein
MCHAFDMQDMMMMMTIVIIIVCHHSLLTFLKSMMNQIAVVFKNQVKALYESNHYGFLSDTGITWLITLSGWGGG